jgi:hypothetical protein
MKKIIIKLGNGDLDSGFSSVNIELKTIDRTLWEDKCSLEPAPDLKSSLDRWQLLYQEIVRLNRDEQHRGVKFADGAITNVSSQDLRNLHDRLNLELNKWVRNSDFSRVERSLRTKLSADEEILVAIQASQRSIWQLPWYLWDFFTDYPSAVEVFSNPQNTDVSNLPIEPNGKVDILALFGIDPLLNLDRDLHCLKSLPDVNLQPFETTSAQDIVDRLNLVAPDIFYLSGHGESVEYDCELEGIIYLDSQTSLEISVLKPAIKKAVTDGLQIAIFNCCSGLGIADRLSDVNIPYLIVMRAEIPNHIAQEFLEKLLFEYSNGADFVRAFQLARDRISISTEPWLKFANWLPVLFHNPLSQPMSWQDSMRMTKSKPISSYVDRFCRTISAPRFRLLTGLGLSLILTGASMGLKSVESIGKLEHLPIDLLSQVRSSQSEDIILLKTPQTVLGKIRNSEILTAALKNIEQSAKPQAFLIDRSLAEYLPTSSSAWQCQLNHRIFDRSSFILAEDISKFSRSEIEENFNGKTVVIMGEKSSIYRTLNADRVGVKSSLNLLRIQSKSEEFIWISIWSILSVFAIWQIDRRLFILTIVAVAGSQIILGGILLMMGNGVPMIITSIVIISAATIAHKIDSDDRSRSEIVS